jgi:hypothetical protein
MQVSVIPAAATEDNFASLGTTTTKRHMGEFPSSNQLATQTQDGTIPAVHGSLITEVDPEEEQVTITHCQHSNSLQTHARLSDVCSDSACRTFYQTFQVFRRLSMTWRA